MKKNLSSLDKQIKEAEKRLRYEKEILRRLRQKKKSNIKEISNDN